MSVAGRMVSAVLVAAIFAAGADCACIAGTQWGTVQPRAEPSCEMTCCGEKPAGKPFGPGNAPVPCKSTCPHCGQLLVQDSSPGFHVGLGFTAIGLALDDLHRTVMVGGESYRIGSHHDRSAPIPATLLALHCALIV